MALVLKDRVKQAAAAPGTGTITLGATAAGFQSFSSVGNGNTTYFAIVDPISGAWEVNYGVYTSSGTTLTRNATPLSSSTGTLVNFTGAVDVFVTYPSENAVWRDTAGVVVQQSFGAITATSAALTSGTITGAPVNATDIVNKEYADSIASGLNYHQPVNYASTAALPAYTYNNGASGVGATITANANGALSLGGGSPSATQRVLVKDEIGGNAPYNGIYTVTQAGTSLLPFILTRATDYDTSGTGTNEIDAGDYVLVISGTLASTAWVQQTPLPITVGTTALTFLQFNAPITYYAGTGLNLSPATTFNISNTGVTATTYGSASAVPVVTFNAQGQATGVTNTTIAIAGSQVSGNISGQAGSVANALTLGTYLTGGTYNGSAAVTATVDATSANTASKVVARDSSGNFSAGTITATLSGSSTSATTATNLAGGAANQIPYQTGSGATSFITAASGTNTVLNFNGSTFSWSAGTISGVPLGSNLNSLTAGTYLTGTAYNGSAAQTWTVDAASANTASTVVARDASGNFSASTITASLSGNATTATTATNQSGGTVNATTGAFSGVITSTAAGGTVLNMAGQSDSFGYNATAGFGTYIKGTAGTYIYGGGMFYDGSAMRTLLQSGNYNSYAPTLTGTGASGTWGINITGSAGSAGSSSSVSATTSTGIQTSYTAAIDVTTPGTAAYGMVFSNQSTSNYAAGLTWAYSGTNSQAGIYVTTSGGYGTRMYIGTTDSFATGVQTALSISEGGIVSTTRNYFQATSSARAPIFYDSNDTTYYLDPNSTTSAILAGSVGVGTLSPVNSAFGTATDTKQISIQGTTYGVLNLRGTGGTPAYYSMGVGDGRFFAAYNNLTGIHGLTFYGSYTGFNNVTNPAYNIHLSGTGYATADWRAPIFYDSDNTAYYVNPAAYSYMYEVAGVSYVYGGYLRSGTNVYTDQNYGYGLIGAYSSYRYQGVYAMGDAYKLPADGTTTGSLYGMAWSHPNAGGVAANLNSHGLLLLQNGSFMAALSTNGTFSADVRGTIFYDYNNTGYYIDPNGTSSVSAIVADNWFRTVGLVGLYSNSYGQHLYPNITGSYWTMTSTTTYGATVYRSGYEGGIKGYNYWDSSGYGLLHGGGGWSIRGNPNAVGGQFYGSWFSDTDLRAPIFYDYNDTSYYADPASTSSFNVIRSYALSYQGAVSDNNTWGMFFDNALGYAYAIYRASGAWTHPYPDLRIAFHTGIQIGANASYGGVRFYDDYDMATEVMSVNYGAVGLGANNVYVNNSLVAGSSLRAPIFYDSNNTGYYVDPNGTSILNVLNCYGNVTAYYSSDIKFKTNVRDIPNALETVESIGGKLFDWTDEYIEEHGGEDDYFMRKEDFGVVAQDVLKVFPVAVRTRPDGSLAVDYEKLSALAFAAVASLSTRVKSLEARI